VIIFKNTGPDTETPNAGRENGEKGNVEEVFLSQCTTRRWGSVGAHPAGSGAQPWPKTKTIFCAFLSEKNAVGE